MLPSIETPEAWRSEEKTALVAQHLLSGLNLDVSRSDLEDDIVGALTSSSDIIFEWTASVNSTCELLGTYSPFPPRIRVSRRLGVGRANFTAAHEVGHHLQAYDAEWGLGVLAELRRTHAFIAQDVEERVSNQVATRLLMPDAFVASEWTGSLTPDFVRALTRDGRVSREAASMRAVAYAGSESAVVVIARPDGQVTSARASDASKLAPPPRRTLQPDFAKLAEAEPGHHRAVEGFIYATGVSRSDLTYDWVWDHNGTHLIVVAVPEYRFGDANWGGDEMECLSANCGSSFSRSDAELCLTCRQPICPDCSACACEKAVGKLCDNCFTIMSIAESDRGDVHEVCPF